MYNAKQRDIEVIGSCCTLVANQINRNSTHKGTVFGDLGVAKLLLGTILLDTVNLDPKYQKATPKDIGKSLSNLKDSVKISLNLVFKRLLIIESIRIPF